jgi:hypothetical protein
MPVEIFSQKQFEDALPVHKCTAKVLWQHTGLIDGEHTYTVRPFDNLPYVIAVRSSVKADGYSAATGQDSIRAFILTNDGKPFGSKISRYTTRLPGWQSRLTVILRTLAKMIKEIAPCDSCGQPCPPFKVKKQGPNKGRLFSKCINNTCKAPKFTWLSEVDE